MRLRLRPLGDSDEGAFRAAHEAMAADDFEFGLWLEDAPSWAEYIATLEAQRHGQIAPGRVRAAFLVADVDGAIVGRTSLRFELNDYLAREGGHVGYGVLREHRRRGYAIEILRQSLVILSSEGVDRVLVTCDEDNLASAAVIERCGGELESVIDGSEGVRKRRYWIGW